MSKKPSSIESRLIRVVVAAIFGGVLLSVTIFTARDFRQSVLSEKARLHSSAAAFAAAAADGVKANDTREVLLVLRGIRELPDVHYAAAFDLDGKNIAEIGQAAQLISRESQLETSGLLTMLTADTLDVRVDVQQSGAVIGTVVFVADITGLRNQYATSFAISLAVGLLVIILTAFVARRQVARVIAPLGELTREFTDIGERSDLTRRIANSQTDEVGILIDAFNEMFTQIERRDDLLREHRDNLEQVVETRTSELRSAKEVAEQANASKSDFLATMSHEIRTPMNGMLVMAEMLSAAPLAPRHLRYADLITRSGKSLLNIINDILDYSKIEAGKMAFESIPFSLDTLIEDAASLFAERAREKGLTIAIAVSSRVPVTLIGDPTRLSQVIGNLVNNALKFTDSGGVFVEAQSERLTGSNARIRVNVRDTGVGIEADKLGEIFERFSQADQSITRRYGGTGLGLSISRRLIEGMGGSIGVASQPSEGSDFQFELDMAVGEFSNSPLSLAGRRIAVHCNGLNSQSLEKLLVERGAEIVDHAPELTICDASGLKQTIGLPCVYVRAFADTTVLTQDDQILADITAPIRRIDLDAIIAGLTTGDWAIKHHETAANPLSALPDLRHLKVLAVDDMAVNREVLAEALSAFRITPQLAQSGHEAIERFAASSFDVVFMDCSMPGMDGYEATARLRHIERASNRPPARVIALTAHVSGEQARLWRDAGMDTYIAKPFTIAQIRSALTSAPLASDPPVGEPIDAIGMQPLVSPDSLAMFRSLSGPAGDRLARKVFGLFLSHAPVAFQNLGEAAAGSIGDVAKLSHALKSMCASAGAARAAAVCQTIENGALRSGGASEADLTILRQVLEDTFAMMNDHLSKLAAA